MPKQKNYKNKTQRQLCKGKSGEGLRPAEKKFIDEYIANGFNSTKAYKAVFENCLETSARVKGSQWLAKDNVKNEIECRLEAEQITDSAILRELWDIAKNYRGEKTINASVQALNTLAKCRGMVTEVKAGDQFFQNNYLVYKPITEDNKDIKKEIDSQGRLIE